MQTRKILFKTLGTLMAVAMLMAFLPAGEVMAQTPTTLNVAHWSDPDPVGLTGRPSVLFDGTNYHLWYGVELAGGVTELYYTTSTTPGSFSTGTKVIFTGGTPIEQSSVTVIKEDDVFKMIAYGANTKEFALYTSSDGTAWTKGATVFTGTGLPTDWQKLDAPFLLKDGTGYKLYIQVKETATDYKIYLATSTTIGGTYTLANSNSPVLTPDTGETRVHHPTVVKDGSQYYMWYATQSQLKLGLAKSTDGITWTKSPANPIINVGFSAEPSVVKDGDTWHMYYMGSGSAVQHLTATGPFEFQTIQAAIDAADPGDTIILTDGTYDEDVTINTPGLTLQAATEHEAVIEGTVKIAADGVTVDGFSINNFSQIPNPDWSAIYIESGADILIANNLIDGTEIDPVDNLTVGIHTPYGGTAEATLQNNTIKNVRMGVYNQGASLLVTGNIIEDSSHCGIGVATSLGTEIIGNEIRNSGDMGIEMFGPANIKGNTLENNGTGIWMTGAIAETNIGSEADGADANTITGSTTYDIHASGAAGPAHIWADNIYDTVLVEGSNGIFVHVPEGEPSEVTVSGVGTVDAGDADTTVAYSTTDEATITTEKLEETELEETPFGAVGKYVDVKVAEEDVDNVTELEVRVYYTAEEIAGSDEANLVMYWHDGSDWRACSDTGVNTGDKYIWAQIKSDTSPTLAEMTGTPFGPGGTLDLDKDYYKAGELITITVGDAVANDDPIRPDQITVDVVSTIDTYGISVTLTETGLDTGIFTGSFTTTTTLPAPSDVLGVKAGAVDTVTATYNSLLATAFVDDAKPTIINFEPADEAFVLVANPTITAELDDDGSGIDVETAEMTVDGDEVDADITMSSISYQPEEQDFLSEGLHTVTVNVSDLVGNAAETASWSFTVDTVEPTVAIDLDPEPPYTAEGTITFTLTFSEDMDTMVVPSVSFGLHDVEGGWSEESLTEWVGTFAIDESWGIGDDGEQTLKVSGFEDEAGNVMIDDTSTQFTIDLNAPDAPTLSAPVDEATIEDTSTPAFGWVAVNDGSGVTYQLQVDDDDDFSSPVLDVSDIEETSYTPAEGLDNALYSWRVRAIDGAGNEGEWSLVRTFTLNADTEDPVVTLISPNGGEVWNGGSKQTISWTAEDNITGDEDIKFTLELLRGGSVYETIEENITVADEQVELEDGVFSYTWTIPEYNNNYYRIQITAEDEQENTATDTSDNDFTIVPLITSDIELFAGWNLISLPLIPNDTSIEVLLADLVTSDSVAQVVAWPYDVDLGRIVEMRWNGVQLTDITDLEDGPGYWIQMTKPDVLEFDGVPMVGPGMAPPAYNVYAGWNLIGFKSQKEDTTAAEYLGADVSASMRMMYGYDAETGFYSQVSLDDPVLKPGSGYWLAVSTNGTIYPPAS